MAALQGHVGLDAAHLAAQRSSPTTTPSSRWQTSRGFFPMAVAASRPIRARRASSAWGNLAAPVLSSRFTSVYHLTDAPLIVSGEYMLVLDPRRAYVPGLTAAHEPGTPHRRD